MRNKTNYGKTISTKVEQDLTDEFESVLLRNGHTKQVILRVSILEYIKRYTDSEEFKNYVDNIQYE